MTAFNLYAKKGEKGDTYTHICPIPWQVRHIINVLSIYIQPHAQLRANYNFYQREIQEVSDCSGTAFFDAFTTYPSQA